MFKSLMFTDLKISQSSHPDIACAKMQSWAWVAADLHGRETGCSRSDSWSVDSQASPVSLSDSASACETTSSGYRCWIGQSRVEVCPFLLTLTVAALLSIWPDEKSFNPTKLPTIAELVIHIHHNNVTFSQLRLPIAVVVIVCFTQV